MILYCILIAILYRHLLLFSLNLKYFCYYHFSLFCIGKVCPTYAHSLACCGVNSDLFFTKVFRIFCLYLYFRIYIFLIFHLYLYFVIATLLQPALALSPAEEGRRRPSRLPTASAHQPWSATIFYPDVLVGQTIFLAIPLSSLMQLCQTSSGIGWIYIYME